MARQNHKSRSQATPGMLSLTSTIIFHIFYRLLHATWYGFKKLFGFVLFEFALLPLRLVYGALWLARISRRIHWDVVALPEQSREVQKSCKPELNPTLFSTKNKSQPSNSCYKPQLETGMATGSVGTATLLPPPFSVITKEHRPQPTGPSAEQCNELGRLLTEKLACFGVHGEVTAIRPGPVIIQFEYRLGKETKISKITSLEDDLAMALGAMGVRIVAPIPGKNAIGFEIAHKNPQPVYFDQLLESPQWQQATTECTLPLMLGTDGVGKPTTSDLASMPHLLVAGSTGSGKSVAMHAMISSLLMARSPEQLKMVLIDPKRLEFAPYANIPHLLCPVITDMDKVSAALGWLTHEMERRYQAMAEAGVRTIDEIASPFPCIVAFIDELADLMMIGGRDIETHLVRLAQMARAAGIHLVVATQRPSVDVVTGLIKVNFPSRIAFRVSSRVDSRTILDEMGAERLLGRGDMLFMHPSVPYLQRIHGAYIASAQVEKLTSYLRKAGTPEYVDVEQFGRTKRATETDTQDELYNDAYAFARERDEISISMLQRYLRIGFNRSARLIDQLEAAGVVAPAQGGKPRKVL